MMTARRSPGYYSDPDSTTGIKQVGVVSGAVADTDDARLVACAAGKHGGDLDALGRSVGSSGGNLAAVRAGDPTGYLSDGVRAKLAAHCR